MSDGYGHSCCRRSFSLNDGKFDRSAFPFHPFLIQWSRSRSGSFCMHSQRQQMLHTYTRCHMDPMDILFRLHVDTLNKYFYEVQIFIRHGIDIPFQCAVFTQNSRLANACYHLICTLKPRMTNIVWFHTDSCRLLMLPLSLLLLISNDFNLKYAIWRTVNWEYAPQSSV